MALQMIHNYDSLNDIINSLKKPRESNELTLQEMISKPLADLQIMLDYGWQYQDTMLDDEGNPSGIPIDLAEIVLTICEFCARHNIDLVEALSQLK